MPIEFVIKEGKPLKGRCIYRSDEYSFTFEMDQIDYLVGQTLGEKRIVTGSATLLIGTLQIEIEVPSNKLLYIWGYHPLLNAIPFKLPVIKPISCSVFLKSDIILESGDATGYVVEYWKTYIDNDCICIGDPVFRESDKICEIAEGNILVIRDGNIISVLLYPEMIEYAED